ncbi:DUF4056 domain-containing protein [Emticicia sp. CRIBPO]|uniref:DUF4056 domain-containing protein n=1 Tax=Emticicia sp. CRIBPO TaxID=2683258 RepID=UPI00141229E8|nr:DUF4056 domain-containing protein [Emticicia sp. CRIBPO]NBA88172.1 DUF4056 domain-containing protein [Emticicia sp. CRIBPO]
MKLKSLYTQKLGISGLLITLCSLSALSKSPVLDQKNLNTPPPRIIRTCCSFGADVRVSGLPFVRVTDITNPEKMGDHKYLGNKEEENGIIYTRNGGFIDMGHLRDMADWTAYLYNFIKSAPSKQTASLRLGYEGGSKNLHLNLPENISDEDVITLAGKIAYDLSVWHEISTWFGASYIPMVPERYSSFSVEDAYSNLLGVQLGMKALKSDLPYEEAMTLLVSETLKNLGAVTTDLETYEAMNAVKEIWWSEKAKLPSRNVLLKRQFEVYDVVSPLVINQDTTQLNAGDFKLYVPKLTASGSSINDFYELDIKVNMRFPLKKINIDPEKRKITQHDFPALIRYAEQRSKMTARNQASM